MKKIVVVAYVKAMSVLMTAKVRGVVRRSPILRPPSEGKGVTRASVEAEARADMCRIMAEDCLKLVALNFQGHSYQWAARRTVDFATGVK